MAQKRALLEAVAYNLRVFLTLTLPLPLPWILGALFPRPLDRSFDAAIMNVAGMDTGNDL